MANWQLSGFQELGELGVGGGGRVVLARHEATGTDVAVKYLAPWLVESDERLAAFRIEAELMAGLVDKNLVTLYEYVETDAGAAIAMELVEGVAMRDLLEWGGPLTPEAALSLMKGSLLGLAVLHRQGVVHRDYKPENVMVSESGTTKLVDYGIAAPVGEIAGIAGTPLYMAPEQWAGEPATAASDVYAASATFVEALTGRTLFTATTVDALRVQHMITAPSLEEVPEAIRGIAEAGLAKDPADRITDSAALVTVLEAVAGQAHGQDWERRGRAELVRRVALLAVLFPHSRIELHQTAQAETTLGQDDLWQGADGAETPHTLPPTPPATPEPAVPDPPAGRRRFGSGRWGLAAAAALIVAAGAGAGGLARAADASAAGSASAVTQLNPTVFAPLAGPTPTPAPSKPKHVKKGKPKRKAKHDASPDASPEATPSPSLGAGDEFLPSGVSPYVLPPITGVAGVPVTPVAPVKPVKPTAPVKVTPPHVAPTTPVESSAPVAPPTTAPPAPPTVPPAPPTTPPVEPTVPPTVPPLP